MSSNPLPAPHRTLPILVGGFALLLVGVGLLGTLIGVRGALEKFTNLELGLVMSGYYLGYVVGTYICPIVIRRVGHIRAFAAFAALTAAAMLAFGILVHPWAWLPLRIANGFAVVSLYMVVESWLNEQSEPTARGQLFSYYTMSTLGALAVGQFALLAGDPGELTLFAAAAILVALGIVPIAVTRVREPAPVDTPKSALRGLYSTSPLAFQGALVSGLVNSAFWGMGAVYAQRAGLDALGTSIFLSTTVAGGVVLQWPVGRLSDRFDRRAVLIGVALAGAGVAALVPCFGGSLSGTALAAIAFVYGGLLFPLYGLSVAHANDHAEPGFALEVTRGLLLVYGVGAVLGPLCAGGAMAALGAVGLPLYSAAGLGLLGVFGLWRMTRRASPATVDQGDFVAMARTTQAAVELMPVGDDEQQSDAAKAASD